MKYLYKFSNREDIVEISSVHIAPHLAYSELIRRCDSVAEKSLFDLEVSADMIMKQEKISEPAPKSEPDDDTAKMLEEYWQAFDESIEFMESVGTTPEERAAKRRLGAPRHRYFSSGEVKVISAPVSQPFDLNPNRKPRKKTIQQHFLAAWRSLKHWKSSKRRVLYAAESTRLKMGDEVGEQLEELATNTQRGWRRFSCQFEMFSGRSNFHDLMEARQDD